MPSECVGTSILDPEQIVLNEVVTEGRLGQGALRQSGGEGGLRVGAPPRGSLGLQALKEFQYL